MKSLKKEIVTLLIYRGLALGICSRELLGNTYLISAGLLPMYFVHLNHNASITFAALNLYFITSYLIYRKRKIKDS